MKGRNNLIMPLFSRGFLMPLLKLGLATYGNIANKTLHRLGVNTAKFMPR